MVIEARHKFVKQLSAAEAIRLLAKYRKGSIFTGYILVFQSQLG